MSRSPRNWDKAKRDENAKHSFSEQNWEKTPEDGMPSHLRQRLQERNLKPTFVERIRQCDRKSFRHPGALEKAIQYIRDAKITILSLGEAHEGHQRCEFQMQFYWDSVDYEGGIEVLGSAFEGKPYFIGANCTFVFWFSCPEPCLSK